MWDVEGVSRCLPVVCEHEELTPFDSERSADPETETEEHFTSFHLGKPTDAKSTRNHGKGSSSRETGSRNKGHKKK